MQVCGPRISHKPLIFFLSAQAPNPDDPLNKEAAAAMQQNPSQFERNVATSVSRGCSIGGDYFPPARGERTT